MNFEQIKGIYIPVSFISLLGFYILCHKLHKAYHKIPIHYKAYVHRNQPEIDAIVHIAQSDYERCSSKGIMTLTELVLGEHYKGFKNRITRVRFENEVLMIELT